MDERNDDNDDVGDAETVPELIEGDIAIDKVGCKNLRYIWDNFLWIIAF